MFGQSKPLASLSSGLLARKGQAKPAMRSQGYGGLASIAAPSLDDLGWNDMGAPEPAPAPEPVAPPPVVLLREALAEKIEAAEPTASMAEPAPEPVEGEPEPVTSEPPAEPQARPTEPQARPISLATAQRIGRDSAKQTKGGKAAFTLRLDGPRHLRLRLASAVTGRSAQIIVSEALDRLLDAMPEVDALAAQLPAPKRK